MSKVKPLLKSDGTIYQLSKPNPLMKNQEFLSEETVIFHNMDKKNTEIESTENKSVAPKREIPIEEEQIEVASPPVLKKEDPHVPPPTKKPEQVKAASSSSGSDPQLTVYHCLPSYLEEYIDELYGEKHISVKYGEKFLFEGIEISDNGIQYMFKTTKEVSTGSIVYPSYRKHFRGNQIKKNWWQVSEVSERDGMYYHQCILSRINPDFS